MPSKLESLLAKRKKGVSVNSLLKSMSKKTKKATKSHKYVTVGKSPLLSICIKYLEKEVERPNNYAKLNQAKLFDTPSHAFTDETWLKIFRPHKARVEYIKKLCVKDSNFISVFEPYWNEYVKSMLYASSNPRLPGESSYALHLRLVFSLIDCQVEIEARKVKEVQNAIEEKVGEKKRAAAAEVLRLKKHRDGEVMRRRELQKNVRFRRLPKAGGKKKKLGIMGKLVKKSMRR